ncbi:MAG: hypothetical protein CMO80_00565 [Verrucomicrobiales bacterium]|nr:hypothetical protein [Verrucomicrobiales bacterium]|tara:strand:+ start:365 stop:604 length:240 start_codon:yes stop_codon:yes gene_type:complete
MKTVSVHEAKTHLSKLLAEVEMGDEITICRGTVPVARLAGLESNDVPRPKVGEITSKPVTYSDDCFAPLTDDELEDWGI